MAPNLATLKQKREIIKAKVARFKSYVDGFQENPDTAQLKLRMQKIDNSLTEFETVQSQIELAAPQDVEQVNERDAFETAYFEIMAAAHKHLERNGEKAGTEISGTHERGDTHVPTVPEIFTNVTPLTSVKLPTVQLPTFSGSYNEWQPYHEVFSSLIHTNGALSDIQKFHYLRSSLKGEAAKTIESLQLTSSNYAVAWKLLTERFENKRLIVQGHVRSLFDQERIERESSLALRRLVDTTLMHTRALQAMQQPTDSWDTLLVHLITSKLDAQTLRAWESEAVSSELPTMKQLVNFLQQRCQMLEALTTNAALAKSNTWHNKQQSNKRIVHSVTHVSTYTSKCKICSGEHQLYQCEAFLNKSIEERLSEIKCLGLCFNCLRAGHLTRQCKSGSCKLCKGKHNTLLHSTQLNATHSNSTQNSANQHGVNPSSVASSTSEASSASTMCYKTQQPLASKVMLATAQVLIADNKGQLHCCRALLDAGSQSNFMTEQLATKLNLHKEQSPTTIGGIGTTSVGSQQCVQATIKSRINAYTITLQYIVLPNITQDLPTVVADTSSWAFPPHIQLADPDFNNPQRIDLLLGAGIFFELLCIGQLRPPCGYPTLQKTTLGWIISGPIETRPNTTTKAKTLCHLNSIHHLNEQVSKFWELENCAIGPVHTPTDIECEEHFRKTTTRDSDGRFVVRLPFKETTATLGDSKKLAIKRFYSLEKRLVNLPARAEAYTTFMQEYQDLGHMSLVPEGEIDSNNNVYYLPHHGVIREDSTTTKLRVVFDASAKTTSGVSLNDTLRVGPTIQDDLFSIILRFRQHQFVITADVEKMYRQIRVHPDDTDFQRIVWRASPARELTHYRLNTVTYGTACAPFLATRCIKQLALENKDYPEAAASILQDFYVDDLLTGGDVLEEVVILRDQINTILQRGCFKLRKWCSNDPRLIPKSDSAFNEAREFDSEQTVKSLGLLWNPVQDNFEFYVQSPTYQQPATKRSILSTISRIFDPLGLVGPVIVKAKILLQQLWTLKLDWDEAIPIALHTAWTQFSQQLPEVQKLRIPRKVILSGKAELELHGFCDASMSAYGACVYEVTRHGDTIQARLLCSKSRVAPIRQITLPRLELCAALLLTKLITKVRRAIHHEHTKITLWSDSTIVLAWIRAPAARWKTFVANRVSEIQTATNACQWKHIRTEDNPADLLSRGCLPGHILHADSWWNGPKFIAELSETEVAEPEVCLDPPEQKSSVCAFSTTDSTQLIDKYSSLLKLQRVTAYSMRFIHNCRARAAQRRLGPLSTGELHQALLLWIKRAQMESFPAELKALREKGEVSPGSRLKTLHPFLDSDSVIRVGGRLELSSLSYNHKHPIVLPTKHTLTKLIATSEHERQLHAGPTLLLASLRQRFWPLNGRRLVRQVVHQCVTCFKARPRAATQLMGQLPKQRTEPMRPFLHTGIDYCGPIFIRESHRRGNRQVKAYIAIFVCFSTKAIHIELAGDLTSEAFLGALRRFISRRGHCACLYSDNASTFVGANNELKELYELFRSETHQRGLQSFLNKEQVSWHFIPPYAPNFGGLWEAAVKSAKFHLKRIVKNAMLTYEETYTCLTQIEACLNSRPLSPISEDPNDLQPLTPGHFLIGDALTSVVEPDLQTVPFNRLSRWQLIQRLTQQFWSRWSKEYLSELHRRTKWSTATTNISAGDMVLVKEDNTPPCSWTLGRITDIHYGRDNHARVFSVRTSAGTIKRSITKICPLPKQEDLQSAHF